MRDVHSFTWCIKNISYAQIIVFCRLQGSTCLYTPLLYKFDFLMHISPGLHLLHCSLLMCVRVCLCVFFSVLPLVYLPAGHTVWPPVVMACRVETRPHHFHSTVLFIRAYLETLLLWFSEDQSPLLASFSPPST